MVMVLGKRGIGPTTTCASDSKIVLTQFRLFIQNLTLFGTLITAAAMTVEGEMDYQEEI
jgi:hypothetical protein